MSLLVKYFANISYSNMKHIFFGGYYTYLCLFSVHCDASLQSFFLKSANEVQVIPNT